MSDETQSITKPKDDSAIAGVSIRGWIALGLVGTICVSHLCVAIGTVANSLRTGDFTLMGSLTTIGEPLYSMAIGALGFYFGQKTSKTS